MMRRVAMAGGLITVLAIGTPAAAQRDRLGLGEALAGQVIRATPAAAVEAAVSRAPQSPCAPAAPVADQVQMLEAVQSEKR